MIYAGGGVINAGASAELTELALVDRLPVTCTLMGLGAFPAPHAQWLGMLGMHGTRAANYAMDEADLIVAVGARFDDRITGKLSEFAPRAKFIHIDIDPAEISKNVPAHIPIVGDAKNILARLLDEYRALEPDPARLAEWWERIERWRAQHPLRYEDSADTEIKPQYLVQALYEATTSGDCILATDIGQHQMWAAQYFHFTKPRRWIQSGGLGHDGLRPARRDGRGGRPAGAHDGRAVAATRSIQMNMQELSTLRDLRHPGQGRDHEQRLPRHGAPVAGAVLGPPLLRRRDEPVARLRQARRGVRVPRRAPDGQDDAGRRPARGARARRAGRGRRARHREETVYPMIAPGQAARDMVG